MSPRHRPRLGPLPLPGEDSGGPGSAAQSPLLQASGQQVLYIDDDETLLQLVHRLLTGLGLRVTCFQDARQALDALHAAPRGFDLVITDLNMPRLSGLDVAREVARLHPGLPVIISSANLPDELCTQAAQAGVSGLYNKVHTLEALGDEALRLLSR